MYQKKNKFFHGIMFHHFCDKKVHIKSQGAITKDEFHKLIKFIGRRNILDAEDFIFRFNENKLDQNNMCLTFDDGIKSQFDVALPVLEDLKIKSFFFIQSSIIKNKSDMIEVYRYFRTKFFKNVDEFYSLFFKICKKDINKFFRKKKSLINSHKKYFSHYSINDIKFRFVRDFLLNKNEYENLMKEMFFIKSFNVNKFYKFLYMNINNIKKLKRLGHVIGLHSHTHPYLLEKLNYNEQMKEYKKNKAFLSKILKCNGGDILSMSHPCNSYNKNTLKILEKLNIEIGFRSSTSLDNGIKRINNSRYEIAREDHSAIIRMIKK